ncbi:uncharacterized protein LOC142575793 isoform X1 [Dermacentor variabilis]|uniref:uncharacterized protein LOC142575793 isoform X1 n=1 Tax=Dermacentor variabilis TaxID=34621 RepID=UPI003F5BEE8D
MLCGWIIQTGWTWRSFRKSKAEENCLSQGPDIGDPVDLQMAEKYSVSPEGDLHLILKDVVS